MAEPTWTLYLDDQFQRSNTSVGSGADNNTGVPGTPNTGPANAWYDHEGNKFYINSNQLKRSGGTNSYQSTGLYRATAEATVDQRIIVDYPAGNSPSAIYMRCSGSGGAAIWFNLSHTSAVYAIGRMAVWNGSVSFSAAPVGYPSYDSGKAYSVDVRVWGTGPTNWRVVITNTTDSTVVYDQTSTISSAKETAGVVALDGPTQNGGVVSRVRAYIATFQVGALSPVAASVTKTLAAHSWTSTIGGTAPVTLALHKSTDPLATLGAGTLVADVTSVTPGDTYTSTPGGTAGTTYYYWLRATDSTSPTAQTSTTPARPLATKTDIIKLGLIGDSITEYIESSGSAPVATTWAQVYPKYTLAITNRGIAATSTGDWTGSTLTNAISAMTSAGCTHCLVMLGTNDAASNVRRSASAYRTNMASICAAITAAGIKAVLNTPPCYNLRTNPDGLYDATSYSLLDAYVSERAALANGSTIYLGDTWAPKVLAEAPGTYFGDQVHPNATGNAVLQRLWWEALGPILGIYGSSSGGGAAVGRIFGGL